MVTKSLYLTYDEKDYDKMKKVKDKLGLSWEDFVFLAITNLIIKVEK